ncbi:MAG: hypothetical protein NT128_00610 [Proteobacteria bacterium]|nr:hypothetical protein [Pseudomonadota bacterium]
MKIKGLSKAIVLGALFIVPALAVKVGKLEDENRSVKPILSNLYQEQRKFLRGIVGPNGVGVNLCLVAAAKSNQVAKVELLLNRPLVKSHFTRLERLHFKRKLQLKRKSINLALVTAAENGHADVVGLLLNLESLRPSIFKRLFYKRQLRPNQEGINLALAAATGKGQARVVRMLVDRNYGRLRPDQTEIIRAYHTAVTRGKHSVVSILENFVPTKEWEISPFIWRSRLEFDDSIFMPCEFEEKPLIKKCSKNSDLHDNKQNSGLELLEELITSKTCNKSYAPVIA